MRKSQKLALSGIAGALMLMLSATVVAAAEIKSIAQDIKVVVKTGDNLTTIVKQVMGAAEFWEEVAQANQISSPNALKPGQVIVFPGELVQQRNFARVVFSKGRAQLTRLGSEAGVPVDKGARVFLGDVITTGEDGFVSLSFAGESLINVQPDSRIQIVEFDCFDTEKSCVVNLSADEGQMNFDIRNIGFKKPPLYSIETPYASAAVRGTRFDVDVLDGSVLGVTEGAVRVTASGGLVADLPMGKGTLAGEGRSVTTIYDLLKQPEYSEHVRFSAEDYVTWTPIDNARSYKYVIAENESLSDVIVSGSTDSTFINMLSEPQQFYLATRALDENGLKGFRAVQRIDQVDIDENASAPELEIELSDNQLIIVNSGEVTSEIHIGDALEPVDELSQLLRYDAYDLDAGKTLELEVESEGDIYIISRAVLGSSAVSPYGNIYEFKRSSQ